MSFGSEIARARKAKGMSQKELASLVQKEDGNPISPQYLNDIERDRRNAPSDHIIESLAETLEISPNVLYFHAGQLPKDFIRDDVDNDLIEEAFTAFRKRLGGN